MPINRSTVIFIIGPTAIGKTPLSIKSAKRVNGEIISCDSMQVYKGMDLLSQPPSAAQKKNVRYHLVRFLNPQKEFSVAAFVKEASLLIDEIIKRKKIPIITGGTGLYVKGLVDGLFPSPKADLKFRKKMYDYAARYGSKRLHKKLTKLDKEAARLIHPNDTRRIVRALEVRHLTGKTITDMKAETKGKGIGSKYRIKIFGLTAPREEIYSRINDRVDLMFESGVVNEVRRLRKKRLSKTAGAVLGLKEIAGYLKGEYDIETAKELMKRNTRRFAKRQLTWFRADKRVKWFDVSRLGEKEVINRVRMSCGM